MADSYESLKIPPHSIEAEQSVLGGLLLSGLANDSTAWDTIADKIIESDFYRQDHRLIFRAIADLVEDSKPLDLVTVSEWLKQRNDLENAGGFAYLATMAKDTPSAANIRAYADIVREKSVLRQLISVGTGIADSAFTAQGRPSKELLDEAEQKVFKIAEQGTRQGQVFKPLKSLLKVTLAHIEELSRLDTNITGVSTGYSQLDEMTSGLQKGDLIIVAGRPSMGKTTFSMNIAEYAAAHKKLPTAVFSMEMPAEQLTLRLLSSMGRVDQHRIRTGKLTDEDWPRIATAVKIFADVPMFIDDSPALSPTEVRARARRLMREHGQLGLIVLDYLQLMQTGTSTDNRTAEISEISRGLKSLAKELAVPVIALSQLNRSLEQRPNKRPVMSDLRECVTGDTLVMLADGRRVPIRDLVGRTPNVLSVNAEGQLENAVTDLVWSVGKKETVRISFASGRTICCSKEHRLRALWDWQYAGELQPGDRIALARHLPEPIHPQSWPEHEIILLAHLVGDGSYIKHQPLRYTTASEANSQAVTQAAEALGSTVTRHPGKGNWHQLVISGNGNRWHPQGVGKWLKNLGIFGQRSREKHLPVGVFQLPNVQLALFLRHLWATDGSIHVGKAKCRIYFATASELLIRDVAALLLRFGIVARIKHITTADSIDGWFTADVSGVTQQRLFMREIGAFGSRADNSDELMRLLDNTVDNTNVDTLPESVFDYICVQMQQQSITHRRMATLRGTAYGGNAHFNFAPSRDTLSSYAKILDDDALRTLVSDGLFWDRVVAVESVGEAEVFDLTVPGNACWLADGIVSHNSGAIEQDADLIIFIYRDEVYNPESPDKGTAEIIIAKQRNGPIGSLRLTFLGKYTRFENYTPDIYTPGFE
ncbi:MAG: replicative DNA helicase [Thiothrix lacustris]|uniref:Replicative DNA helicase n=1 Tax=Thiothrix lacustris TaxID=525917 RepID=A0A1Y1QRB0_9GAMM|nr:MAG: replicative DNA helicase [Thiothrix lacustris]